ncbi:unnamed protein product [Somion occarium]|uniref:Uncharacterized protein n=1 Tax=Somion occarium TaxID=3059160 RepID=A0ABP1CHJ0_9APHY
MAQGIPPRTSLYGVHLTFQRHATSVLSLRNDLAHIPSSLSSFSNETCYGLGSDLGTFLYWFGERLLDGWVDIAIRLRLRSIRRALKHRGSAHSVDGIKARYIRHACEDLLELCSDYYSLRIRRRAFDLLLTLLKPLDAWSFILLESNFVQVLSAYRLEPCSDLIIATRFDEIVQIVALLSACPCRCEACMHALRQNDIHIQTCCDPCGQRYQIVHCSRKAVLRRLFEKIHLHRNHI